MFTVILGILAFFVGLVLMGWVVTLVRVRMGFVKHGQEAIEEYFGTVAFALLMTIFMCLISLEGWIG